MSCNPTKRDKKARKKEGDKDSVQLPFVSICTPTFNRRPFFPMIIECFRHQTYPKERLEWIILDDGSDKIGDLVDQIPQVQYFPFDEKMTLGKKRNLMHEKSRGDFIVYMDDDDYYPPERVSHAVETLLKNPQALCAGSSEMHIFFKHIMQMYTFGPYGPNHATAATFAFPRRLLDLTRYQEEACLAEEKHFLKNYTIPFVQLDSLKTILVFSHIHNTFDKKTLLDAQNPFMHLSPLKVRDVIVSESIANFFLETIDTALCDYDFGKIENKPDVLRQIQTMTRQREDVVNQRTQQLRAMPQADLIAMFETQLAHQAQQIQQLQTQNQYLETKIKEIIQKSIQERRDK